jgi:hypothetical protein
LRDWLNTVLHEDLLSIPGIGKKNKELLENVDTGLEAIHTTFQLFGKFLSLKGPGVSSKTHCDLFSAWLHEKGIHSHRTAIVQAIAERSNLMIPSIYDGTVQSVNECNENNS